MRSTINLILALGLLISEVFLLTQIQNTAIVIVGVAAIVIAFMIIFKIKTKNEKLNNLSKKTRLIILLCYEIIFNLIQFALIKDITWKNFLYIFLNDLTSVLIYILVSRRLDFKKGLLSLIIFLANIPLMWTGMFNSFYIFGVMLYAFCMMSILYEYPFDKRNIVKYILIGLLSAILMRKTYFILLPLVLLALLLIKKKGKKKTLIIGGIIGLSLLCTYLLLTKVNIEQYLFVDTQLRDNNVINIIAQTIFYAEIMGIFISEIYLRVFNNFIDVDLNIKIYSDLIANILLITAIVENNLFGFINVVLPLLTISFSINIFRLEGTIIIPYYKRFIKPKTIKKVSCVIPNYNYADYIEERIDSVVKQTYPLYELIVLDDVSKDNSIEVIEKKLKEVKEKYPDLKVRFIPNEKNSGNVFKQWAKAFKEFTGDYLWIAEADDSCNSHFLNVVMKGFEKEDVVLSYAESLAIDENDEVFRKDMREWVDTFNTHRYDKDYINDGKKELEEALCTNNTIANASGVVFKRDDKIDYQKYLKEAQDFRLAGDWYFYSKVLLNGGIAYSCDSLNYHRIHRNSVTTTTDNFVRYKEITKVQDTIRNDIKLSKEAEKRIKKYLDLFKRDFFISDDEIKYDAIDLNDLIKEKKIKDEVLLSIVIPVYDVEEYIEKCIKSFIKTLPEKTEVIIINDGSPDNSEEIIKKYADEYKQIRYIKKENGGLSSVKNRGLKEAKGRYIIFLDSDDYVSSNMYRTMLKKAIDTDADIVYCDMMVVYEDGRLYYSHLNNKERKDELMQILDTPLMATSCNKLAKKELYDGLEFPEYLNNEDVAVSPILCIRSKNIVKIDSPFYKYMQRSGSIQNSEFNEKRFMIFDTSKMCFESAKDYDNDVKEKLYGAILTHQILGLLIYEVGKIKDDNQRMNLIRLFCQKYRDFDIDTKKNKYVIEYLKNNKLPKLLDYIYKNEYDKIDNCIKDRVDY